MGVLGESISKEVDEMKDIDFQIVIRAFLFGMHQFAIKEKIISLSLVFFPSRSGFPLPRPNFPGTSLLGLEGIGKIRNKHKWEYQ